MKPHLYKCNGMWRCENATYEASTPEAAFWMWMLAVKLRRPA